ncbi:MAG: single-stranded-DNA-specific exonuclease RecJ [Bacteroidota bacterium]
MVEKRWVQKNLPQEEVVNKLIAAINVSLPIATILAQRGITTYDQARSFFNPSLSALHDPFLMKDMSKAVARFAAAIDHGEKILVYGDYDVDGTTSVALFFGFVNSFYSHCDFYIPDRYSEGYGISKQGVDWAIENEYTLIISLDCGIRSVELITYAKENGVDFIICDHHRPGQTLPPAVAVLDPKREDCEYPFKELPGCGIGFKFMQAIVAHSHVNTDPFEYLDLVAVSVASDIVPITGENRILAFSGIQKLNTSPRPGLKALMKLAGLRKNTTITGIVFGLAPRINAAGRISHAKIAVNLLLAESEEEAYHFAEKLNIKNKKRRDVDSEITSQALAMIAEDQKLAASKTTVLFKNDWHKGVIGIVASRCIETYHRPTIILTESNGKATGSARSVPGFDVHNAIEECSELLTQFGGHKYAAGLTMELSRIEDFKQRFEEVVSRSIPEELLVPQVDIDTSLDLDLITPNFLKVLNRMEPFGPENLRPVFAIHRCELVGSSKVIKEKHLKFTVKQTNGVQKFETIGFNMAHYSELLNRGISFNMAASLEENEYQGVTSIQLTVKDLKFDLDRIEQ